MVKGVCIWLKRRLYMVKGAYTCGWYSECARKGCSYMVGVNRGCLYIIKVFSYCFYGSTCGRYAECAGGFPVRRELHEHLLSIAIHLVRGR